LLLSFVQQVIYTLSSNSFSFLSLSKAKILETQVPLQTFDTCLSACFWFRFNFRFSAFVHLTEDSMLPSSILASRLVFGFGSTFAFQLRSPYRGSIFPSSILASRLVFGFGLTFAFQLSSPYRGSILPSSILTLRLIFGFGLTLAFQISSPYRGSILPSRYSPYGLLSGLD